MVDDSNANGLDAELFNMQRLTVSSDSFDLFSPPLASFTHDPSVFHQNYLTRTAMQAPAVVPKPPVPIAKPQITSVIPKRGETLPVKAATTVQQPPAKEEKKQQTLFSKPPATKVD